jgi:signal transduction histidine kinase
MDASAPPDMLDFEALLTNILQRVQHAIPCDHATIALLDDSRERLVSYRSIGAGPPEGQDLTSIEAGVIGWVSRTGDVALVPDVSKDERYIMLDENTRSELAVPIRVEGEIFGVFNVESYELDAYTEADVTLLMALADQAALSLHTAKLYTDLETSYAALQNAYDELALRNDVGQLGAEPLRHDETLPHMVRLVLELADADRAVIALWDDKTSNTIQTTFVDHDDTHTIMDPGGDHLLTREILESHEPRILTDLSMYEFAEDPSLRQMHTALGMPLLARGNDIGALFLFRAEDSEPFTPHTAERLNATVNHLALALDNHALFANITRKLRETELLQTIARKTSSTLHFPTLLADVTAHISEHLPGDVVAVWLVNDISGQLELVEESVHGVPADALPAWPLDDEGIIPTVFHYNTTFHTHDLAADERLTHAEVFVQQLGLHHAVVAPIYSGRGTGGVIFIGSRAAPLEEDHLKTLTAVGGQLGIALSNADLYVSERKRANLMQRINKLGAELTALLDVDELLLQVVLGIQSILGYEAVYLLTQSGNGLKVRASATPGDVKLVPPEETDLITTGAVGRAIRTMRSYLIRDLRLDPQNRPPYEGIAARSELVLPLRSGRRVIGALDILSTEPAAFDDTDREAVETLGTQIAIAIENARLYAETQKRLNEQQIIHFISRDLNAILDIPRLADATVYQMAHALKSTGCMFALYEAEQDIFVVRSLYVASEAADRDALSELAWRQPLSGLPSSFRTILAMRNPVTMRATDETTGEEEKKLLAALKQQSALLIPLIATGRPLGLITWFEDRHPREFTQEEIRLAQTLANQAAVALERARLHEETQRQLKRETLLRRAAETANNWLDREAMLAKFLEEICQALQTSLCVFYRFKDGALIRARHHQMPGAKAPRDLDEYISIANYPHIRQALDNGDILRFAAAGAQADTSEAERLRHIGYHASMLAPLISRGRLAGAVEVLDDRSTHRYSENDAALLQSLCSPVSIAVDNADLFEQLEERAQELEEANRLKTEFLANISHELRTPMNSIIGFTEALLTGLYGELSTKQADRLRKVERNAHSLLTLINDLLDISKIEAGRINLDMQKVDVAAELLTCIESVEPQIQEKTLTLQREIAADLPHIDADPQRLRQIFINLLSNAVKFTDEGHIRVEAALQAPYVHISVSDTGIGIAPADQVIIFDEFRQVDGSSTRRYEGTGLGLAISHKLVIMLGGEIWVESEVGEGSTFHVMLPISP